MNTCEIKTLQESSEKLAAGFENGVVITQLLQDRSDTIDSITATLWSESGLKNNSDITLVAVGGYGRAEMHPGSDVDLLLLLKDEPSDELEAQLSDFLTSLWDLGLEVGHSVRTIEQCIEESALDLTVITNLTESRCITGNHSLFELLRKQITPDKLWPSADFFEAKLEEKDGATFNTAIQPTA